MEQSQQSESKLCTGCHQFYASAASNFLCSVCFKKTLAKPENPTTQTVSAEAPKKIEADSGVAGAQPKAEGASESLPAAASQPASAKEEVKEAPVAAAAVPEKPV